MAATDLPYWEAQGQMVKYGIYCDPCTLQGEYEHWYEQGDGAEEEPGGELFWDVGDPGDRRWGRHAFIWRIFVRILRQASFGKGYVFGTNDGMTRGTGTRLILD
ncbi:predicted protein [Histoplasma capsulatum H143]|uniref:Uncharacterized protein n=1 Tax=Ajellomyces capsulatus (strain H143) TaxID=544712 RepID=C6HK97_AJECH|nr:predicted protein [Histoplasma capsulatum H143]